MSAKTSKNTKKKSTAKLATRARLSPSAIDTRLSSLSVPWKIINGDTLCAEWRFADFSGVCAAVNHIIDLSVRADHHPQVTFGYRDLRVSYTTHSAGGLTDLDFYCAKNLSAFIANLL